MRDAKENTKQSGFTFTKLVKVPFRFLIMARDAYVRSVTSCSAGFVHGGTGGFGLPAGGFYVSETPTALPRSFTLNSLMTTTTTRHCGSGEGEGEYQGLVRAASTRTGGGSSAVKMRRPSPLDLRRNYSSVAMRPIDEEKPCEFGEKERILNKR